MDINKYYVFPLLVFLGLVKLVIFYSFFNFPIVYYLKFDDVFFSVLDVLMPVFVCIVFLVVLFRRGQVRHKKIYSLNTYALLLVTCLILPFYYLRGLTLATQIEISIGMPLLWGWTLVYFEILISKSVNKISDQKIPYLFLLGACIIYIAAGAASSAISIRFIHLFQNVDVVIKNKLIESTESEHYLGKTSQYMFFYNPKELKTIVYPMADISKIVYR